MNGAEARVAHVNTPLPGPRSRELFERWAKVEAQCAGYQARVVWDEARGVVVRDVDGNAFIDWTSGVLVTNVGHCHPDLVRAVQAAAARLLNNYECLNEPRVEAAEKLVSVLPPAPRQVLLPEHGKRDDRSGHPHHEAQDGQVRDRQLLRGLPRTHLRGGDRRRAGRAQKGLRPDAAGRHPRPVPLLLPLPVQGEAGNLRHALPRLSGRRGPGQQHRQPGRHPGRGVPGRRRASSSPRRAGCGGWRSGRASHGLLFALDEVQSSFGRTGKVLRHGVGGPDARPRLHRQGHRQRRPRGSRGGPRGRHRRARPRGDEQHHGRQPGRVRRRRRRRRHHEARKPGRQRSPHWRADEGAAAGDGRSAAPTSATSGAWAWSWASNSSRTRARGNPRRS